MVKKDTETIDVPEIRQGSLTLTIVGTAPLVLNRMSEKVRQGLLLPAPKKNAAARASTLKHNPLEEFASSPYTLLDEDAPTLLALPAASFKRAFASAALDLPGASKAQIGRLVYVPGEYVPVWGTPMIYTAVVRSADMNKTPDIRTRAIVPHWAAVVPVLFAEPLVKPQAIVNLASAAGVYIGVGDGRPEKGKLSFGTYRLTNEDDEEFSQAVKTGARADQRDAMANPMPYDAETRDLLAWWEGEAHARGFLK